MEMRLIVDSNQADPIRYSYKQLPTNSRPTLVIPHLVWVELLYSRDADKRRRALGKFPLMFGMDMPCIIEELGNRSEDAIRSFVPIHREDSTVHHRFLDTFQHPTRGQLKLADELKADAEKYRQKIITCTPLLHKKHKDQDNAAKSRGETLEYVEWHTIRDGTQNLFLNEDAPYRLWLIELVATDADGRPRSFAAKSCNAMFDAVWDNPMLRRFLQLQALVKLGYAQKVWEEPKLNRQIKKHNDDGPDTSLVLYARNGDTILTADNIQERIRHVDVENCINVTTWAAWLATRPV
jgi:hypothetical protein